MNCTDGGHFGHKTITEESLMTIPFACKIKKHLVSWGSSWLNGSLSTQTQSLQESRVMCRYRTAGSFFMCQDIRARVSRADCVCSEISEELYWVLRYKMYWCPPAVLTTCCPPASCLLWVCLLPFSVVWNLHSSHMEDWEQENKRKQQGYPLLLLCKPWFLWYSCDSFWMLGSAHY